MSNLVIVAIPEENDRVWKVSSEQVPHLTLLFLGDVDQVQNLGQITQFVEHAVTLSEHGPFYLDVDHRGTLGDAEADVLFFNKRSWNLKWIKQFRGQLLQNQQVRTAYDGAPQHTVPQDWVPHLTLGYPDTPAKEQSPENDYPLYSVCFDRIAVWIDDFDGPEFRLEWPDREMEGELAVAYSDTQKAALRHRAMEDKFLEMVKAAQTSSVDHGEIFVDGLVHGQLDSAEKFVLEHYGIKGMRWGRRSTPPTAVAPTAASVVPHGSKRKTQIEVKGGENQPAHQDAIKVEQARVKLKKSGPKALSNQELREVAERVRLEQQAVIADRSKGHSFVRNLLGNQGKQAAAQVVREGITKGAEKIKK